MQIEHQHEPISGSCAGEVGNNKEIAEFCGNDVADSNGNVNTFFILFTPFIFHPEKWDVGCWLDDNSVLYL